MVSTQSKFGCRRRQMREVGRRAPNTTSSPVGTSLLRRPLIKPTASSGDAWHMIGTVNLTTAGAPILTISNGGSGLMIADAVYVTSSALYNDGSPAPKVTLGGFDGILLQRQRPVAAPTSQINSTVNAASFQPAIASAGFVSIIGTG